MHNLSASFILGYHGCDADVAEDLLRNVPFLPSENDYDWLGSGIYFWEANPLRGLEFATEASQRKPKLISNPTVIGAVIDLGYCLDLTSSRGLKVTRPPSAGFSKSRGRSDCGYPRISRTDYATTSTVPFSTPFTGSRPKKASSRSIPSKEYSSRNRPSMTAPHSA